MIIRPSELPVPKLQMYLQSAVAPRPIAFVSSIDAQGSVNLSPFSFFNMFSMNPPILIFSPSRRVRDNSTKHTLQNVLEVPEVVINIVSYNIVEKISLASCDFPKGTNEFVKAGFTEVKSELIKPPRVAEAPVSFECKVNQVIPLGKEGGAGNLVICEVQLMHIKDEILDAEGKIDPHKLDAVARMGQDYYCRASGESVFVVPKPNEKVGIGIDQLPESIRSSNILTGNDLAMLANTDKIPELNVHSLTLNEREVHKEGREAIELLAHQYLKAGRVMDAWRILLT